MRKIAMAAIVAIMPAGACSDPVSVEQDEWFASLEARPGFAGVSGVAAAFVTPAQTIASVAIEGAAAGAVLPWHIHFGTCDDDQGIVGGAAAYPPLVIDATGTATASANVGVALQAGADYFVNVHAAPDNLSTIVACGELLQLD